MKIDYYVDIVYVYMWFCWLFILSFLSFSHLGRLPLNPKKTRTQFIIYLSVLYNSILLEAQRHNLRFDLWFCIAFTFSYDVMWCEAQLHELPIRISPVWLTKGNWNTATQHEKKTHNKLNRITKQRAYRLPFVNIREYICVETRWCWWDSTLWMCVHSPIYSNIIQVHMRNKKKKKKKTTSVRYTKKSQKQKQQHQIPS